MARANAGLLAGLILLAFAGGESSAQATCPSSRETAAALPSAYAGKTNGEVMGILHAQAGACVRSIDAPEKALDAILAETPALPDTLENHLQALAFLSQSFDSDMRETCPGESGCLLARALATRIRALHASAGSLASVSPGNELTRSSEPPLSADESDFSRLTTPSGIADISIGMRPGDRSDDSPRLARTFICDFVLNGMGSRAGCATSGSAASQLANARCDDACAARASYAALAFERLVALRWIYRSVIDDTAIAHENRLDRRNAEQWRSYWFGGGGGRTQWPWEMWINGALYKPREDAGGRFEPPTSAVTFLHPGFGASFYETDGDEIALTAVVEIIGYSQWSYDPNTGSRREEWGASAVAAYTQSDTADDWAYGVLVRTPYSGVNLAWLRRDSPLGDEDALMLSVNLGDLSRSFLRTQDLCRQFGVSVAGLCGAQ